VDFPRSLASTQIQLHAAVKLEIANVSRYIKRTAQTKPMLPPEDCSHKNQSRLVNVRNAILEALSKT